MHEVKTKIKSNNLLLFRYVSCLILLATRGYWNELNIKFYKINFNWYNLVKTKFH